MNSLLNKRGFEASLSSNAIPAPDESSIKTNDFKIPKLSRNSFNFAQAESTLIENPLPNSVNEKDLYYNRLFEDSEKNNSACIIDQVARNLHKVIHEKPKLVEKILSISEWINIGKDQSYYEKMSSLILDSLFIKPSYIPMVIHNCLRVIFFSKVDEINNPIYYAAFILDSINNLFPNASSLIVKCVEEKFAFSKKHFRMIEKSVDHFEALARFFPQFIFQFFFIEILKIQKIMISNHSAVTNQDVDSNKYMLIKHRLDQVLTMQEDHTCDDIDISKFIFTNFHVHFTKSCEIHELVKTFAKVYQFVRKESIQQTTKAISDLFGSNDKNFLFQISSQFLLILKSEDSVPNCRKAMKGLMASVRNRESSLDLFKQICFLIIRSEEMKIERKFFKKSKMKSVFGPFEDFETRINE